MTDDPVAALADLSLVEHRLAEIRQDLARLHQTLEGSPAIGDGRSRLAVADARRADLQRRLRDAEQQERTERARARTHESQLYSGTIHTPRELSQLAGELEQLKGRLALEEVAEMELLSELDEADAELRGATDEAAEARRALAERQSAEQQALEEIAEQRSHIPTARLHLYDRVMAHRPPPPIVEVRGGTCTGCRLPLSTSQVRALRMATEPITCETCGRIQRLA
jgi:predicted  nucleic acid-binding Zn-ribbon protein